MKKDFRYNRFGTILIVLLLLIVLLPIGAEKADYYICCPGSAEPIDCSPGAIATIKGIATIVDDGFIYLDVYTIDQEFRWNKICTNYMSCRQTNPVKCVKAITQKSSQEVKTILQAEFSWITAGIAATMGFSSSITQTYEFILSRDDFHPDCTKIRANYYNKQTRLNITRTRTNKILGGTTTVTFLSEWFDLVLTWSCEDVCYYCCSWKRPSECMDLSSDYLDTKIDDCLPCKN